MSCSAVLACLIRSVENGEFDRLDELLADDICYENPPEEPFYGREATTAALRAFRESIDGLELRVFREIDNDRLVVQERLDRFRLDDEWVETERVAICIFNQDRKVQTIRQYTDEEGIRSSIRELGSGLDSPEVAASLPTSDPKPRATGSGPSPLSVVQRMQKALLRGDDHVAADCFAPDVEYRAASEEPVRGRERVLDVIAAVRESFDEFDVQSVTLVEGDDAVCQERLERFRIGDRWGQVPTVRILTINGEGRVQTVRDYFDMTTYREQLSSLHDDPE